MSSSLATVDLQVGGLEVDLAASGPWHESFIDRTRRGWQPRRMLNSLADRFPQTVAATSGPDIWSSDDAIRDLSAVTSRPPAAIGRPVSRVEALRIARRILERAEEERRQLVEWEAERGIDWGDGM